MKPETDSNADQPEEAGGADAKAAAPKSTEAAFTVKQQEQRDTDAVKDESGTKGSSNTRDAAPKRTTKPKKSSTSSNSNKAGRFPPDRYPYPPRGPYPGPGGPGMHHGGPRGPPPPYGYGGPPEHYRGPPPPPHYRQMPPMPHQGGPYGPNGHFGPPHPSMGGPHYGNPYGHGHYMGGPHMPYPHPNFPGGPPPLPSENSISSNKSKSITTNKSSKSQSSNTAGARKKRTIDGVHDELSHPQDLPSAYSFRRNNSSTSSSTTVTAGNNTSTETEDSKRHELPPLSHSSHNFEENRRYHHRRDNSGASTTSSLSVGGFSLSSYEGHRNQDAMSIDDNSMLKQSPKRRKGHDSSVLVVDTSSHDNRALRRVPSASSQSLDAAESNRFQKLTMEDTKPEINETNSGEGASLFLSLSTSPINNDVDATPISKNTNKKGDESKAESHKKPPPPAFPNHPLSKRKESKPNGHIDRNSDTPTPPIPSGIAESAMMTDEHMLNSHLRNQSFTPLPHMNAAGDNNSGVESPSNMGGFGAIAPQLSWSIAGDTPSLGDLAEWEEHAQHAKGDERSRPSSTTSGISRNLAISPHSFSMWADDDNARDNKDGDDMRLSILTPHSELGMTEGVLSGTTTPLPMFFEQPSSEERENHGGHRSSKKSIETDHIHNMFMSHGGHGSSEKNQRSSMHHFWKNDGLPTPVGSQHDKNEYGQMGLPPTPMFAASEFGRDDGFMRSPHHGSRDDFFPAGAMYGHPGSAGHDRVRNLRGRVPPGHHMAPMPLHIPPPNMSSHLPLTSPMGVGHGKAGLWSPHHGGMPPLGSPLHMSPMNMSQSKRKCVPLKPPIPSKFQGDIEKVKSATVPEFTSLVNFPAHMSQKQSVNLPEGMRCCVMCGQACPCSSGNKNKKCGGNKNKNDGSLAPRNSNGQDMLGDKGGYAIIPTQNKGLCTLCDVNVWVVCSTGLEIKWCKGCKNFRPWASFGDKGLATKCLRCRERQREKYALQKEEKEKARLVAKAGGKN